MAFAGAGGVSDSEEAVKCPIAACGETEGNGDTEGAVSRPNIPPNTNAPTTRKMVLHPIEFFVFGRGGGFGMAPYHIWESIWKAGISQDQGTCGT